MSSRITRGFAWNHLYKIVEYGGVYLYSILVMRKFGPALGGSYAVYTSITVTLAIFGAFAVDGVLLRYLPRIMLGERTFGAVTIEGIRPFLIELLAFRLFVNFILAGLVVLTLAVLPHFVPGLSGSFGNIQPLWPFLVIFLLAQAVTAFSTFTLVGLLQVKWVFFASLITRFSLLAVGFFLIIFQHLTLKSAVAVHAFAAVLNGALLLYWVYRHVEHESKSSLREEFLHLRVRLGTFIRRPSRVRLYLLLPFMLYGITTWGSDFLSTVLGRQPDILMMRALLGENSADIGLYAAAAMLAVMTEYVFLLGLGGTLVSVFSELAHQDENHPIPAIGKSRGCYTRLYQARRDISGFQTVSTAPIFGFMLAFCPLVMAVMYGPKFSGAVPIMFASLIMQAITVIFFGGGMQVTSLVAIGKERVVFKNRLTWGAINLLANYFLILKFGAIGAMIGTQCSNCGACATESVLTTRWIGQSFQFKRAAFIVSIVAISLSGSYLVSIVLPIELSSFVRLLAAGCTMALLTAAGYLFLRVPEAMKAISRLRGLLGNSDAPAVVANL